MSQENVDIVRRMFDESSESDAAAVWAALDPEIEWDTTRFMPDGDVYHGHDGSKDGPISTPVMDDARAFALGPRGRLVALDLESGSASCRSSRPRYRSAR